MQGRAPRVPRWLKVVAIVALVALLGLCNVPSIAQEAAAGTAVQWQPQLAPQGPVVVVVSLPAQQAQVYRNGIRIGMSPVSTGRPGFETPSGVYKILEKAREHRSNLYEDAPMPYMQRLTWDGIALHAGILPGHPGSHGCIRLPADFAEALFGVTSGSTTVIVSDALQPPSLLAPLPLGASDAPPPGDAPLWQPQAVADGPISLLLSTSTRRLVVLRDGVQIGRLPVELERSALPAGTTAYVLLEGTLPVPSAFVPGRPARPWMAIPLGNAPVEPTAVQPPRDGALRIPAEFAAPLYDLLTPGTVLVVSDDPLAAVRDAPAHSH